MNRNPILRLADELCAVSTRLQPGDALAYWLAVARTLPQVISTKSLRPADRLMKGRYSCRTWNEDLVVDCDLLDQLTSNFDNTLMFSSLRELCCRDVYLRAFTPFH